MKSPSLCKTVDSCRRITCRARCAKQHTRQYMAGYSANFAPSASDSQECNALKYNCFHPLQCARGVFKKVWTCWLCSPFSPSNMSGYIIELIGFRILPFFFCPTYCNVPCLEIAWAHFTDLIFFCEKKINCLNCV